MFDTKTYNARIYTYETEVLYAYPNTIAFYDKGARFYAMLRYTVNRHIDLWFRFAQTYYTNPNKVIGSGLDAITGNRKTDLKVQVRYRF